MKTIQMYPEKNTTFEEMAKELGISTQELIDIAKANGLLNEDGTPTEKAIREGLLTSETKLEAQEIKFFEIITEEGPGLKMEVPFNSIDLKLDQIIRLHQFLTDYLTECL